MTLTLWLAVVAAVVLALLVGGVVTWRRGRHRLGGALLALALVSTGLVAWYGWTLDSRLDDIGRVPDEVLDEGRRPVATGRQDESLTVLLMGADNPQQLVEKPTIAELLADGEWDPGAYRSDSLMVVHLPADRSSAYVVSIPRDSLVEVHDERGRSQGEDKLNAAFADYGPYGSWRTVESLTGLRLDHMAIIDFAGFRDLTTAIGGVDVYIPEEVYDSKQDQRWEQGRVHLEDDLALKYVRMRYGLLEGDFDRVDRQQNFLRAVMQKVLADEVMGNPLAFDRTLAAITGNLTVDAGWTNGDLRRLALSLRSLDTRSVRFVTLPFDRYATDPELGSVNLIARKRAAQLWRAVRDDQVDRYLERYPEDELPPARQIN